VVVVVAVVVVVVVEVIYSIEPVFVKFFQINY